MTQTERARKRMVVCSAKCEIIRKIKNAKKKGMSGVDMIWNRSLGCTPERGRPGLSILTVGDDTHKMRQAVIEALLRHDEQLLIVSTQRDLQIRWGDGFRRFE